MDFWLTYILLFLHFGSAISWAGGMFFFGFVLTPGIDSMPLEAQRGTWLALMRRLDAYLSAVDPATWRPDGLAPLPGLDSAEDRLEELEIARDWFGPLREMYRRAAEKSQVVVHEFL